MVKRLGLGLFKGLLIGGAIGAAFHFGLGLTSVVALLGYLIAMGAGGTTGVFAGKPPWREGAWIEAVLKGMVGVGLGALFYWLSSSYAAFTIPIPGLPSAAWSSMPLLFTPAIAGLYGALVELDNTGEEEGDKKAGKKRKVRVAASEEAEEEEEETVSASASSSSSKKKKA
jgi:hypothetical protein